MTPARSLRVGFICRGSPEDPSVLSGMTAAAWDALGRQGLELVQLDPSRPGERGRPWLRRLSPLARAVASPERRAVLRGGVEGALDRIPSPFQYRRMLEAAVASSRRVQRLAGAAGVDLLFGLCVSVDLCALETELPVVYATDATARLVNESYPLYARRPRAYRRACDEIERRSLARVSAAVFPSERVRRSAIEDYGLAPERAWLVSLGAHVVPEHGDEPLRPDPPGPDGVELVCVASDPVRKRLDFCIDVAEELARRGLRVVLHQVGPATRRARRSPVVQRAGALRLWDAADREVHRRLLRRSHLLLLPSRGEMFGIAPCEAAHFGRPSLVSDAGGLPSAVLHERTGLVLPVDAPPERYADEIEKLCHDPQRYRALSEAALHRARSELRWEVWGRRVAEIARAVVAGESRRAG